MSASDTGNVVPGTVTADDAKAGSVILRGVTVALDTDVGQVFVARLCPPYRRFAVRWRH